MQTNLPIISLIIFGMLSPIIIENSSAQVLADVDLECEGSTYIDVYPGSTRMGVIHCTVSNPSLHVEKISITLTTSGLAGTAPGTITVAAGAEEDFQVSLRADERMPEGSRQITVSATVQEMSGVPPPNNAQSEANSIAIIKQFAEFNLELVEPTVLVDVGEYSGETIWLEYKVYNSGNGYDTFKLDMSNQNDDNISTSLVLNQVQVESNGPPERFRIEVVIPDDGSDWKVNSKEQHTLEYSFDVTATSVFSCNNGNCMSITVTQNVIFVQNQTTIDSVLSTTSNVLIYGGIGGIVLLLPLLFIIFFRKKK